MTFCDKLLKPTPCVCDRDGRGFHRSPSQDSHYAEGISPAARAGVVVNEHLNVMRADYDRMKATLTNCIRHGAQSQKRTNCADFRTHLLGRIAFVDMLNPNRSFPLRALFDQIEW